MQSKAHSKFDMPAIRRKCKKMMRKKHKKTIKLSLVDKVWRDYVEYGIIRPVINDGKVDVINHFKIEVIGKRDNGKLLKQGLIFKNGIVQPVTDLKGFRRGVWYGIEMTDYKCKGKLYFNAEKNFKRRVKDSVMNGNYYPIK